MGLMIFTGPKLDTGLYNELLYRTGERLLPCSLKAQIDGEIRGLFVEQVRPSPLEKLLELKPSALERVTVRQIMGVDEGPEEAKVRVLARWNDAPRSPAVIERVVGDGRVLLWTTTADRAGSDWPIEPSFVLAVREAVRGTARPTALANTVSAGEHPRRVIRSNQQVSNVLLSLPGSGEPVALRAVPIEVQPQGRTRPGLGGRPARHAPGRALPARLGRGPAGNSERPVRGESRPARDRAGSDRGEGLKGDARAAEGGGRQGAGRGPGCVLGDRAGGLASACVGAARPLDPGADPGDLGRPLALRVSANEFLGVRQRFMSSLWQWLLGIRRSSGEVALGDSTRLELTAMPAGAAALALVVAVVALAYVLWRLYRRERRELSRRRRALLVGLRLLGLGSARGHAGRASPGHQPERDHQVASADDR